MAIRIDKDSATRAAHKNGVALNSFMATYSDIREEHGEKAALRYLKKSGVKYSRIDRGGKGTGIGRNG